MLMAIGILTLVFGLFGLIGQLISTVSLEVAQKLGLQEKPSHADPLASLLEQNTARWDIVLYWIIPLAGVLMIMDHSWWPYLAMIGGGIYLDTGGRELAKWFGLRSKGIKTGSNKDFKVAKYFLGFTSLLGLCLILFALTEVV